MDEKLQKQIEELKTEIIGLKIRLRRLEEFYNAFPDPHDYIEESDFHHSDARDDLFNEAVKVVTQHDRASVSLIQRRLQIGFNRAARMLEQLEEAGVVSSAKGFEPREVLVKDADEFLANLKEEK